MNPNFPDGLLEVRADPPQWSRDSDNPFVLYSITYINRGRQTLSVSAEIQSVAVRGSAPNNYLASLRVDVQYLDFELAAGASEIFRGRLGWYGDAEMMPRLLFLPNQIGVSISTEISGLEAAPFTAPLGRGRLPDEAVALATVLQFYINSSDYTFSEIVAGPGISSSFPTAHPFPGAVEIWIEREAGSPASVSGLFYEGPLESAATEVYQKLRGQLEMIFPAVPLVDGINRRSGYPELQIKIGASAIIRAYMSRARQGDVYRTYLILEKQVD